MRRAAAIHRIALARRADETGRHRIQALAPFADRDRATVAHCVVQCGGQARGHVRPVVAGRGAQRLEQQAAFVVLECGEIRTAYRGACDVHPRADLETRDEHGRARPDHVDRDHVEPVAHREVHGQGRAFGQLDHERPRARADVEVAQEAVAQFEHRRGEHEALAVGQLEQEAGADERRGDARDGRLRDAGQFGQLAVADGRVGSRDATQDGEAAGEGGDFVGRGFTVPRRGRGYSGRHEGFSLFPKLDFNFVGIVGLLSKDACSVGEPVIG